MARFYHKHGRGKGTEKKREKVVFLSLPLAKYLNSKSMTYDRDQEEFSLFILTVLFLSLFHLWFTWRMLHMLHNKLHQSEIPLWVHRRPEKKKRMDEREREGREGGLTRQDFSNILSLSRRMIVVGRVVAIALKKERGMANSEERREEREGERVEKGGR